MDSSFARSMKPQVLTTTTRACPSDTISCPARWRWPSMTSASTRFFGHPSDTIPTVGSFPLKRSGVRFRAVIGPL